MKHKETLRKFLDNKKEELISQYRELKTIEKNDHLDDYQELELACIEAQLNLLDSTIKLCKERNRF